MKKIFYSIIALALAACGEGDKGVPLISDISSEIQVEDEFISAKQIKELKNASKVVYTLPSPVEMADILHETKAVYDVYILNDPNAINGYVTDLQRAMNLGVYFADLSFTSMFDYAQEAMRFMGAAQAMSDELNIQGVFTEDVMMRLEDNMSNKDSLIDIVSSTYMDTDLYLKDNERPVVAKAILAGAWLEGLYIAVSLKTDSEQESQIWQKVGEQKPALGNLVRLLEDCKDAQFDSLLIDLRNLAKTFEAVKLDYQSTQPVTDKALKRTTLGGNLNVLIDEKTYNQIKAQTIALRNNITK